MLEKGEILSHDEKMQVVKALQAIRKKVSWKSGKDQAHLAKRQRMGHLLPTASISDYEHVVLDIVGDESNVVY